MSWDHENWEPCVDNQCIWDLWGQLGSMGIVSGSLGNTETPPPWTSGSVRAICAHVGCMATI